MSQTATIPASGQITQRGLIVLAGLAAILAVALFAGARFGLLLAIGLGFGIVLEGLRFGFAGPWRAMILRRDPSGILAQLLAIALVSVVAFPLLATHPGEITGAAAPIGWAMIGGAFVFGAAMQVVLGCGSGTLVNAGSGNPVALLALPFLPSAAFWGLWPDLVDRAGGAADPDAWRRDGSGGDAGGAGRGRGGAAVAGGTGHAALAGTAGHCRAGDCGAGHRQSDGGGPALGRGLRPWPLGGQGRGGAGGRPDGFRLLERAGQCRPAGAERADRCDLTDQYRHHLGGVHCRRMADRGLSQPLPKLPARAWVATVVAGLLLGYSSRLAFGCNVGAFFSGISTGSLHGWVWFAAAFAGAVLGVRLRPMLGLEARA